MKAIIFFDAERLSQRDARFMVVRRDGDAIGCVAFVIEKDGNAELKSLYVSPQARGAGVGDKLLTAIEAEAGQIGIALIHLETGIKQTEAIGLYRKHGYIECDPFGSYQADPVTSS